MPAECFGERVGRGTRECWDRKKADTENTKSEERGGKLHFMDQPDGSNYLAVKIT